MNLHTRMSSHFRDAIGVFEQSLTALAQPLASAADLLFTAVSNNRKVLACGNGGSAADAQHFIAELAGRFERERLPLAGITLSADTSILTAVANDYGYGEVFARQVEALGQPGDVLVALSTSGGSPNVIRAIEAARGRDMRVVALTGKGGGAIGELSSPDGIHLCVPSDRTMRIQEVHGLMLHALCDGIDSLLLGDTE
jgi:D-sedoheptulose 7-phosphate isomerase